MFFCRELGNDCFGVGIELLLCCQTYYVIKTIYLTSQLGYQWPSKGISSGNAFFYSNLIGFLYREKELSIHTSEGNLEWNTMGFNIAVLSALRWQTV